MSSRMAEMAGSSKAKVTSAADAGRQIIEALEKGSYRVRIGGDARMMIDCGWGIWRPLGGPWDSPASDLGEILRRCRKGLGCVRRTGEGAARHNGRTAAKRGVAMKVMVMIKVDGADEHKLEPFADLAADEITATKEMLAAMGEYNEKLVKAGIMLDGGGLKTSRAGAQVVFEGGTTSVVDGPFTESKEIIAGYWVWQVNSIEEAVEWAKQCPASPDGRREVLEIRPYGDEADFGDAYTDEQREFDAKLGEQIRAQHGKD
jgi:hypothetical protein